MKEAIFDELKKISTDRIEKLKMISERNDFNDFMERYKDDPVGFIEKVNTHIAPEGGYIKSMLYPPIMYQHQEELLQAFQDERFHVVRCARQMGLTKTLARSALHYAYFNSNKTVLMMSYKLESARDHLQKVRREYEALSETHKQYNPIVANTKDIIMFGNGTIIQAIPPTDNSIRGKITDFLLMDDFGYVNNQRLDSVLTTLIPMIRSLSSCKVVIASTGTGSQSVGSYRPNTFIQLWQDAIAKKNMFIPHSYNWDSIPHRDNSFKNEKINQIGEKAWKAEYEVVIKDNQKWQEQRTQD